MPVQHHAPRASVAALARPAAIGQASRWRLPRAAGVGLMALILSGCGAMHRTNGDRLAILETSPRPLVAVTRLDAQRYSPDDWPEPLNASVYLPRTDDTAPRPAALVVHGGGWRNGGPAEMDSIASSLAQQGYVAISIEHRLAPEYRFPAQLHDLQQAMRWIHAKADDWQVDTDRIAGVGFSSGAHLVSLLALAGSEGPLAQPHGGDHAKLAAVMAGGTPSDLRKFDDGRLVVQFIGGTRQQAPDAYAMASPVYHVSAEAPPFFLYHGRWDQLVPRDHATDFYQALTEAGVSAELYLMRGRGHFTSFLFDGDAIKAGIAFLNRHLTSQRGASAAEAP